MRLITLIMSSYFWIGCGQWTGGSTDRGIDCIDGCTPEGTGETKYMQGPVGPRGEQGAPGESGRSGKDGVDGRSSYVPGPRGYTGSPGTEGSAGPQGPTGSNGAAGTAGTDGYSIVTATQVLTIGDAFCPNGGTLLRLARDIDRDGQLGSNDGQQQMIPICNGDVGPAGPAISIQLVDPCGDAPGIWDEVLVRLPDGRLLASFSDNANGRNTRFSILTAGTYVVTDGSACYFSVDSSSQIYNEHY